MKGPRVSGPWLEVWGGNANALPHANSYTHIFFSFIPCGTMSPRKLTFAGSQDVDRVDLSPHDHQSRHVLKIKSKWGDQ